MRSRKEVSGSPRATRAPPGDFEDVIGILTGVRLITRPIPKARAARVQPARPDDRTVQQAAPMNTSPFAPAMVSRKQRENRRGRASLRGERA